LPAFFKQRNLVVVHVGERGAKSSYEFRCPQAAVVVIPKEEVAEEKWQEEEEAHHHYQQLEVERAHRQQPPSQPQLDLLKAPPRPRAFPMKKRPMILGSSNGELINWVIIDKPLRFPY